MIRHLFFISLLVFGAVSFGQLEQAVIGKSSMTARKSNFSGFIGKNKTTLFTIDYLQINRKKQELTLSRFDRSDLQFVNSKNIYSVIDENFYNEPEEVFFQNDSIYLFSILNGLKEKIDLVYLEVFNEYGDLLRQELIDTLSSDESFFLVESEEKEGFIFATHNRYDNVFEQTINLKAIGGTGDIIWKKSIKSPSTLQSLSVEQIVYSIHSPVYILCNYGFELNSTGAREDTDLINTKFALWGYDREKDFLKEFDLRIKNRWINGIKMALNEDNELIIGGFMNETRNYTINGVFSLCINDNLEVITSNYYKYKRSFFAKFVESKKLDKVKELEDIILRDLIVLADGSYFLLGEHFYQYTERNYDPRTNITTTTENYNYNSIVAAYFDKKGNHLWSDRIPKFQHTINDFGYFSSFSIMHQGNDVYLFFNDTDKNNEVNKDDYFNYKSLFNNRKFQISYVHINQEGVLSRGPLIGTDNNYMLRAKLSYQVDPDIFYLYGEVGKSRKVFSTTPAVEE